MLIRDWVEAVTVQSSKDQHKHTAAFRLNSAFQSIARDHLWSWLTDQFYFTTVTAYDVDPVNESMYQGTIGSNVLITGPVFPPDPPVSSPQQSRWAGAEILIQEDQAGFGPTYPIHMRVRSIGNRQTYVGGLDGWIYLDRPLPQTFQRAKIKLFRREYVPRTNLPTAWTADRLLGKIRFRDMVSALRSTTRPTLQHLTRVDYQHNYGHAVESGAQVPQYFQMQASRNIQPPKYAPFITGTGAALAGTAGTYYMTTCYVDEDSGIFSPIGPITTFEHTDAANSDKQVEYESPTGIPEQGHALYLLISPPDPVGFDGREITKTSRLGERMIPFYMSGYHSHSATAPHVAGTLGGGTFNPFSGFSPTWGPGGGATGATYFTDIVMRQRYYPQSDSQMVFLREIPNETIPFCVDGKLKMPWFNDLYDAPPIPDNFQDLVNVLIDAGIEDSSGGNSIQKRGQYEFILRKLRGRDLKRASTGEIDPRHRGQVVPRIDRYGLLD